VSNPNEVHVSRSQLTVYVSEVQASKTDREDDLIKQLLKNWHFDSSVKCENKHTPQKPAYEALQPALVVVKEQRVYGVKLGT
jgi:hypothetical protein